MTICNIFAANGKIKYLKNVQYEGFYEKVKGGKIPNGQGVLTVNNFAKEESWVVSISGTFSNEEVNEAHIEWPGNVYFDGQAAISFIQTKEEKHKLAILVTLKKGKITFSSFDNIASRPVTFDISETSKPYSINSDEKNKTIEVEQFSELLCTYNLNGRLPSGEKYTYSIDVKTHIELGMSYVLNESAPSGTMSTPDYDFNGTFALSEKIGVVSPDFVRGTLTLRNNGYKYEGFFTNKTKYSNGTVINPDGSTFSGALDGNIPNIPMPISGRGKYTYSNGDLIDGIVKNGKLISGTSNISNDTLLARGTWENGVFDDGKFRGNLPSGYYDGEWEKGRFSGECKISSYKNNKFKLFTGKILNDTLSGSFTLEKGRLDGSMLNNKLYGNCKYVGDAMEIEGFWNNDTCINGTFTEEVMYDFNVEKIKGSIKNENDATHIYYEGDYSKYSKNLGQFALGIDEIRSMVNSDAKQIFKEKLESELEKKKSAGRAIAQKYYVGHTFTGRAAFTTQSPFSSTYYRFSYDLSFEFISDDTVIMHTVCETVNSNGLREFSQPMNRKFGYYISGNKLILGIGYMYSDVGIVLNSDNKSFVYYNQGIGTDYSQDVLYKITR